MTKKVRTAVLVGLVLTVLGIALTAVAAVADPRRAFLAWLAAFGWTFATVAGALVLTMTLHVTRASWWVALRPVFMGLAGLMPVVVLLFLPIALGMHAIYPWARLGAPDVAALPEQTLHAVEHQRAWNNPAFFLGRSVLYLGICCTIVLLLQRADRVYLRAPTSELPERFEAQRRISGAGLPIVALTLHFAAADWLMSVVPGWVSNVFGVYVFCGGLVSAVSVLAIAVPLARDAGVVPPEVNGSHLHAIGRLLLMAVILWAYIGFFQLMLIWIGGLPRETMFYGARARGAWVAFDWVIVLGHFVAPFLLLLSRPLKRRARALGAVAAWLLVASALHSAWIVLPEAGPSVHVLDVAPFLTMAGVVLAFAAWRAAEASRAPEERAVDPVLRESLSYRSP